MLIWFYVFISLRIECPLEHRPLWEHMHTQGHMPFHSISLLISTEGLRIWCIKSLSLGQSSPNWLNIAELSFEWIAERLWKKLAARSISWESPPSCHTPLLASLIYSYLALTMFVTCRAKHQKNKKKSISVGKKQEPTFTNTIKHLNSNSKKLASAIQYSVILTTQMLFCALLFSYMKFSSLLIKEKLYYIARSNHLPAFTHIHVWTYVISHS